MFVSMVNSSSLWDRRIGDLGMLRRRRSSADHCSFTRLGIEAFEAIVNHSDIAMNHRSRLMRFVSTQQ